MKVERRMEEKIAGDNDGGRKEEREARRERNGRGSQQEEWERRVEE